MESLDELEVRGRKAGDEGLGAAAGRYGSWRRAAAAEPNPASS